MTVPNETSMSGPYNGNGVTTSFGYDFLVIAAEHLRVVLTDATGAIHELTLGTDYTVSGTGNPEGGGVVIDVAPATGETITILRNLPFTQETDLENQGAFHAQTVEDALDMSVMRDQLLLGRVKNAIHAPDTENVDMELPPAALRANAYLLFDANGQPTFVGSQVGTRYYGEAAVDPTIRPDGSARRAGDIYFNTGSFQFRVYTGTAWTNALPSAALTLTNYREASATAKTTFTIPGGYQTGAAFVYLNGVLLDTSEYTAANGTTVVLTSACAIGDELRVVSFSNFSVADTLARSNNLADLPSPATALGNLGVSVYGKSVVAALDAAALRTLLGLQFGAMAEKASTAQAQVGSDDATAMTPAKTADAIAALAQKRATTQAFTVSGTWTKPTGYADDTMVIVEAWGAGGGGSRDGSGGGGGGGGAYALGRFRIGDLPASVAIGIGAGGIGATANAVGGNGGNTTFGALLTAYGGEGGQIGQGGRGGGEFSNGSDGGRSGGGGGGNGGGTNEIPAGYPSVFGGGGGGGGSSTLSSTVRGGDAFYGGAGGAGGSSTTGVGGTSQFGGAGGSGGDGSPQPTAGAAPGGGGGGADDGSGGVGADGARGEVRVWVG